MRIPHIQYLFVFAVLFPLLSFGQGMATAFQKAENSGVSIAVLDSLYKSALHADTLLAAFAGKEKEFQGAYISLLKELGDFLHNSNFKWQKQTRCFNRIYINKTGKIDYFLFNFSPGEIEQEKEQEFERLLSEFIKNYRFPLTNTTNFAQCSPVRYADKP
ncbi:MAG: hypothetical protein KF845_09700 [Cyclobacteriaceae bacterium]|nr:hypothetical protein [Cyclobacteriaceae bacterium]